MVLLYAHINKKSNTFFIKIPGKALQAALEAIGLRLTTLRCRYTPVGVPTQGDQIGVVMKTIPPPAVAGPDFSTACGSGTQSAAVEAQFVSVGHLPLYIWPLKRTKTTQKR